MTGEGTIIRGVGGFYYIHDGKDVYECRARGIFRNRNEKPLVGDKVVFDITDAADLKGNVVSIADRKNSLIRPAVANVDRVMVVFAVSAPAPNLNLLDRFLIMMKKRGIPVVILWNKCDLLPDEKSAVFEEIYRNSGHDMYRISAGSGNGVEKVRELLKDSVTVLAGPSGVGKSTLINRICPEAEMMTGGLSRKNMRGRHTTRHTELFAVQGGGYILDTPGFSALDIFAEDLRDLEDCYAEFAEYRKTCRFMDCAHINEPDCGVKAAVAEGAVHRIRYENYVQLSKELADRKKYR
ncbi:MAG: ribosome small subunit-dependent GTPase A [Lachnospiraceae bacterium]|nr:ribosome small subunit-dependent GTPase A [Lachnospiraceae bacterium]